MENEKVETKSNMEIHNNQNYIIVSFNPKIHPLDVIYSAAYVFLDRAYVIIGGDPEKEITVEMKPKDEKTNLETLGYEFNNEIINYAVYKAQSKQNEHVKNAIIQRALLTNGAYDDELTKVPDGVATPCEDNKENYIDDPEGIAIPWEEKYGKVAETGCETVPQTKGSEKDSNEVTQNRQEKKHDRDKA